jgi:hypothetical protein
MSATRMQTSDEATAMGLALARKAGEAYQEMLRYFVDHVAHCGRLVECGDYLVALAVEKSEPLWYPQGEQLELHEPPRRANQHLEVVVCDRADGRFIPALEVTVTLLKDGRETGTWDLPFLWHPTIYHYGRNVEVVTGGTHTARVSIARPGFPRHDKVNGRRYTQAVVLEVDGIDLQPAREGEGG